MRYRAAALWLPAILWMAVIFWASSLPRVPTPIPVRGGDKVAHVMAYGLLGVLLARAFRGASGPILSGQAGLWAVVVGLAYGVTDELHQSFVPGRMPEAADVLADAVGLVLGQTLAQHWARDRLRSRSCGPISISVANGQTRGENQMAGTLEITEDNFQTEVLDSDVPTLVDFWGPGCPPCVRLAPTIAEIAGEYDGRLKVGKCNVAENYGLAMKYGIRGVPTVILFSKGEIQDLVVGLVPKQELVEKIEGVLAH